MPGLPLVIAAGAWLGGLQGALLMAPVIGGCAVLSFAGLVGRLAGPRWAPAGALVLALTLPEQYVSRTPFSEPLVQVLLFGGLCLLSDSFVVRRRGYGAAATTLAFLGGLSLGLTVLVSIGSLSMLLPAFPVLALMFVSRRPQAGPLGMGLFLGVACGLYAGLVIARPYLSSLSSQLHLFGLCAAGFGLLTALAAPLAFPGVRAWVRRVFVARPRMVGLRGEPAALPSLGDIAQWLVFLLPLVAAGRVRCPPLLPDHARANGPGSDQVCGRTSAARAPAGGRAAAVLRVEPRLGAVVPGDPLGAACRRGRRAARAATGACRAGLAGVFDRGPAVGAAVPGDQLVRGDRAVGPGGAASAAAGQSPAGTGRAPGADPARVVGVFTAEGAGGPARRLAVDSRRGRPVLRAGDGDPAVRHVDEPRAGASIIGGAALVRASPSS